jgi:G:T/U-mismatch repair DNA glycosylase
MEARVIYCSKLLEAQRDAAKGTNNAATNGKKARKPRYKFDQEWVEAVRHNYDRDLDNDEAVLRHIRLYIEGEYDGSDFRGTYFECAWILIKAEIDRRKARNARARERRQRLRAEKLAAIEAAKAAEQAAAEAARIEAEAKAQAEAKAREEAERLAAEKATAEKAAAEAKAREEAEAKARVELEAKEDVEEVANVCDGARAVGYTTQSATSEAKPVVRSESSPVVRSEATPVLRSESSQNHPKKKHCKKKHGKHRH